MDQQRQDRRSQRTQQALMDALISSRLVSRRAGVLFGCKAARDKYVGCRVVPGSQESKKSV